MKHTRTSSMLRSFDNTRNILSSPATGSITRSTPQSLAPLLWLKDSPQGPSDYEFQSNAGRAPLAGLGIILPSVENLCLQESSNNIIESQSCNESNLYCSRVLSLQDICHLDSSPLELSSHFTAIDYEAGPSVLDMSYITGPLHSSALCSDGYAASDRPYSPLPASMTITPAAATIGLLPDINMFIPAQDGMGVNPADIVDPGSSTTFSPTEDESSPLPPSSNPSPMPFSDNESDYILSPVMDEDDASISEDGVKGIVAILSQAVQKLAGNTSGHANEGRHSRSDISPVFDRIKSPLEDSPSTDHGSDTDYMPSPSFPRKSEQKQRRLAPRLRRTQEDEPGNRSTYDPLVESPVLSAHLGIQLEELQARAAVYRVRHPGEEIDQRWLMAFAGKLSNRGEVMEDFRCYVIDCGQTNRRRDHILTHVGGHIGQRPFKCSFCDMRFLRKNECKRHEASHTGDRPYTCELCSRVEEKSFARQDLLKRHLKRTHGLHDRSQSNKENREPRPLKRARKYL